MLGPMVNPAFPTNQMVGVFNLELARMYGYLYQNTNKNFTVLHALDGYDEISLTGNTKTISNTTEGMIKPSDFGLKAIQQSEIVGGDSIEESAQIFLNVLQGTGTEAQNNVVCANAGVAIATVNHSSLKDGFDKAKKAARKLAELLEPRRGQRAHAGSSTRSKVTTSSPSSKQVRVPV